MSSRKAACFPIWMCGATCSMAAGARRRTNGRRRSRRSSTLLGIGHLLDRRPAGLSGGEKQRVAIGRALLANPRLLLLDEPLAALDGERKAEILPYIERLRDELNLPIVYVSHDPAEILRLADQVLLLEQGGIVASGPVAEIFSRPDLQGLVGAAEAGAVLTARLQSHDEADGLSYLQFAGRQLTVPRLAARPAARCACASARATCRLRWRARRASASRTSFPRGSPAIHPADDAHVDVELDAGVPLRARVTNRAVAGIVAGGRHAGIRPRQGGQRRSPDEVAAAAAPACPTRSRLTATAHSAAIVSALGILGVNSRRFVCRPSSGIPDGRSGKSIDAGFRQVEAPLRHPASHASRRSRQAEGLWRADPRNLQPGPGRRQDHAP